MDGGTEVGSAFAGKCWSAMFSVLQVKGGQIVGYEPRPDGAAEIVALIDRGIGKSGVS
jgi:hypothetical protein